MHLLVTALDISAWFNFTLEMEHTKQMQTITVLSLTQNKSHIKELTFSPVSALVP